MKTKIAVLSACLLFAAGCGAAGTGQLKLKMTDAPGEFESVNVTITSVSAHHLGNDDVKAGWVTIANKSATHDLLKLRDDATVVLGDEELPMGDYNQLRMVVSSATVVTGGTTYELTIPSGETSGLKFKHNFTVKEDGEYEMVLDFDAAESIHVTGNGTYMLQPVIKVKSFSKN